jgi:hypothetical protein
VVLFPTYDAPHYKYAYQMMIMFGVLAINGTYLLDYLYKKELWVLLLWKFLDEFEVDQNRATKKTRITESGIVVVDTSGTSEEGSGQAGEAITVHR